MADEPTEILVPAYEYPAPGVWDPLISLAHRAPRGAVVVIANPDNGPGYDPDTRAYRPTDHNYVRSIADLKKARATVIGYVHDCYGNTNPPEAESCPRLTKIEDDIARWFEVYDVEGIFIDEASHTDVERGAWLTSVVRSHRPDAVVVFNPGTLPSEEFMAATDPATVVLQEQAYRPFGRWPTRGWVKDREDGVRTVPARRLGIIAHSPRNGEADVDLLLDVARRYGIGSVYPHHAKGPIYNQLSMFLPMLGRRLWRPTPGWVARRTAVHARRLARQPFARRRAAAG
ncbi:spherulation-specific family 4 protein [Cellulomonas sp. ATA003]|uniref:spherulation-specific family 4 protein n=1 Tax=Cellulomonas sp. ATA003 TaxID=3073064 RepID=UPI002872FDDC|nr:spherulation-specific family 4 protein [Cellulomonas sp. ATA003]WNB86702.1 spherulation-specific family 4 protein [Cellulomonas sp. ATA003]